MTIIASPHLAGLPDLLLLLAATRDPVWDLAGLGEPAPDLGEPAPDLGDPAPDLGDPAPDLGDPAPEAADPDLLLLLLESDPLSELPPSCSSWCCSRRLLPILTKYLGVSEIMTRDMTRSKEANRTSIKMRYILSTHNSCLHRVNFIKRYNSNYHFYFTHSK